MKSARTPSRPRSHFNTLEFVVTTTSKSAATVILGVALAGILAIVGISFFALAIALPISLAVVDQLRIYVTAADMAIATQLSSFAPLFVVVSVGFFVASLATIVKLIQRVDPAPAA
jgi:hypothetical protein